MNNGGLDIALVVIMAYFLLRGIFRGVVKEVVGVLGLLVAFWVAGVYWPIGAEHLASFTENASHRAVISFMVVFLVVYFLIGLISIFIDKIVKLTISPLGSSLLGALAGAIKGALMCGVLLAAAETFIPQTDKFFASSQLWPVARPVAAQVKAWAPEALRKLMEGGNAGLTDNLRKSISQILPPAESAPAQPAGGAGSQGGPINVDWNTIQTILRQSPQSVSPAWLDKLRAIPNGESLSSDDLKRFIQDHPALFSSPAAGSSGAPPAPPSWAKPAGE